MIGLALLAAQVVLPLGGGTWFKAEASRDRLAVVKHAGQDVHLRVRRGAGWLGPWQRVNEVSTAGQQDEPDVEFFLLAGVRYIAVVWTDRGPDSGKTSIQVWIRVFDEDGSPVSTSRPAPDPQGWQPGTSSWLAKPAAIPEALGGGVRVLYTRGWLERVCYTDQGVHGPLSGETQVSPLVSGDSAAGELAFEDATGACLFAWTEWTGPTPFLVARVDQGPSWAVQQTQAHQQHPSVAWSRGLPVIAWREGAWTWAIRGPWARWWPGRWAPQLHALPSGRLLLSHGRGPTGSMEANLRTLGLGLQTLALETRGPGDSGPWESWPDSAAARGGRSRWLLWADGLAGYMLEQR